MCLIYDDPSYLITGHALYRALCWREKLLYNSLMGVFVICNPHRISVSDVAKLLQEHQQYMAVFLTLVSDSHFFSLTVLHKFFITLWDHFVFFHF